MFTNVCIQTLQGQTESEHSEGGSADDGDYYDDDDADDDDDGSAPLPQVCLLARLLTMNVCRKRFRHVMLNALAIGVLLCLLSASPTWRFCNQYILTV